MTMTELIDSSTVPQIGFEKYYDHNIAGWKGRRLRVGTIGIRLGQVR